MELKMTIDEALGFADEWSRGQTLHAGSQGWRVVCMLLAQEVRRLQGDRARLRTLLIQVADEPNIDKARAIADAEFKGSC